MSTSHATDQIGYDPHRTATLSQMDEHLRQARRLAAERLDIVGDLYVHGAVESYGTSADLLASPAHHVDYRDVGETVRNVHRGFVDALTLMELLVPTGRDRSLAITALEDAHRRALHAIVGQTDIAKQPLAEFVQRQETNR